MELRNRELMKTWSILLAGYIVLFALILISIAGYKSAGIPLVYLTRDPAASQDFHPFVGFISNVGILLWCSSVAICFFGSWLCFKKNNKFDFLFLFISGLLSSILMIDDLFELHEVIFPEFLNLPEKLFYAGYPASTLLYLFYFRKKILNLRFEILLFSIGLFGASILYDQYINVDQLLEDGLKFFGIFTWLFFFSRTTFDIIIHNLISDKRSPGATN